MQFPGPLRDNTRYTRSGNAFSRAFFVAKWCEAKKRCIIVDTDRDISDWKKALEFVSWGPLRIVHTIGDLLELTTANFGTFVFHSRILAQNPDIRYLMGEYTRTVCRNEEISMDSLLDVLLEWGYHHSTHLAKVGGYSKEWDTLSVRVGETHIITFSFFDTVLDEILLRDEKSNAITGLNSYALISRQISDSIDTVRTGHPKPGDSILESLPDALIVFDRLDFFDTLEDEIAKCGRYVVFSENTPSGADLGISSADISSIDEFEHLVRSAGDRVHIYTKHRKSVESFLDYNGISVADIRETSGTGLESFVSRLGDDRVEWHIGDDILSRIFVRNRTRRSIAKNLDLLVDMKPSDYIVHRDHGVGIFREIVEKTVGGTRREYMEIEYAEGDKLFVPLAELHRVSKYIGEEHPRLTRLSTNEWKKTLEKTNEDVERIANELLTIYARRRIAAGFSFRAFPREEEAFRKAFRYEHTRDQKTAILEIFEDMEEHEPMDRLLAGDVGFGKTEVAMNAVYKAFLSGKQSAFISPLVVLAYEHAESLRQRFEDFGVRTAVLTRLTSDREARLITDRLQKGEIDCLVGTHRILSENLTFKNLGLLVVDEEHRFGVLDKEKIAAMKANIDTLSLSATPIPRSLNLSLSGLKKISILSTPPPLKKAISTLVLRWNELSIKQAVEREFERCGQVIFLHNRIASIESVRTNLQKLLGKQARIIVTHGQMSGVELEDRIIEFKEGKYNVLLSTTVIENGVNFLNANTIFIDDAERFGLAQLHQLRGRVGRKDREAYCYLVYHSDHLDDDAKRRLLTIVNHSELGAGFEIAMRDLEMRWAGDILGVKQSGKTSDTGLSLYLRLLEEKIAELKEGKRRRPSTTIELDLSYSIDDDFFDSDLDKIRFFRNLESIETTEDLDYAYETFRGDRDTIPEALKNLFLLLRARLRLGEYGVLSVKKTGANYMFDLDESVPVETVRSFLDLDRGGNFVLVTVHKIKVPTKCYAGDRAFLEELLG